MRRSIVLILMLGISSCLLGQDLSCSIVDGHIQLNESISGLAGIEATSLGGHLSLDFIDVEGVGRVDLKTPFPNSATVIENTSNSIVIGVLGEENRITIEGPTLTAIAYDGDRSSVALDLTVNLGIADIGPGASLLCIPEPGSHLPTVIGLISLLCIRSSKQRPTC